MSREKWPLVIDDRSIILGAGGVVLRAAACSKDLTATHQIALVHRPSKDDWSLPKGRTNAGELVEDAARREILEETACICELNEQLPTVRYLTKDGQPKEVRFWKMLVVKENQFVPNEEIDELRWLYLKAALKLLTYETDRLVLQAAFAFA